MIGLIGLIGIIGFSLIGFLFNLVGLACIALVVIFGLSIVTKTHFRDWLDPKRWKAVLIFLLKKLLMKLGDVPGALEAHEIEQYMFRVLACKKCVPAKCVSGCGCYGVERMNGRQDTCSLGRWAPFKTKEEWNKYKAEYKVEFTLTISDENIDNIITDGYNDTNDWGPANV